MAEQNETATAENAPWADIPDHEWRALAETLIKGTRWDEWRRNGWGWQGERITELASELAERLPKSQIARRTLAAAKAEARDEIAKALFAEAERMDAHPHYSDAQASGYESAGHFVKRLYRPGDCRG